MVYRVVTRADSIEATANVFARSLRALIWSSPDHTMPSMLGAELAERVGDVSAGTFRWC